MDHPRKDFGFPIFFDGVMFFKVTMEVRNTSLGLCSDDTVVYGNWYYD